MRWLALSACALGLGCSSSNGPDATDAGTVDTAPPAFQSGTRLRARLYQAEGGAKVFRGFHDATLDLDCSIQRDDAGTLRCMPIGADIVFADATCTTRVALRASCSNAKYASQQGEESDVCSDTKARVTTYALGPSKGAAASYWTKDADGTCSEATAAPGFELFELGAAAASSTFVALDETFEPRGAGLLGRVRSSSDGARLVDAVYDAKFQKPCTWLYDSPDRPTSALCHVGPIAFADTVTGPFTSSTCKDTLAARMDPVCGETPDVVQVSTPSACGAGTVAYRRVGDPAAPYEKIGDTCSAGVRDAIYRGVGDLADLSLLAETKRTFSGTGSVRAATWSAGDIATRPALELVEGDQEICTIARFGSGSLRCLSTVTHVASSSERKIFADAACTKRVLSLGLDPTCSTAPKFHADAIFEPCGIEVTEASVVGAPFSQEKIYAQAAGTTECKEEALPATVLHPLVGKEESTGFPAITEVVE